MVRSIVRYAFRPQIRRRGFATASVVVVAAASVVPLGVLGRHTTASSRRFRGVVVDDVLFAHSPRSVDVSRAGPLRKNVRAGYNPSSGRIVLPVDALHHFVDDVFAVGEQVDAVEGVLGLGRSRHHPRRFAQLKLATGRQGVDGRRAPPLMHCPLVKLFNFVPGNDLLVAVKVLKEFETAVAVELVVAENPFRAGSRFAPDWMEIDRLYCFSVCLLVENRISHSRRGRRADCVSLAEEVGWDYRRRVIRNAASHDDPAACRAMQISHAILNERRR